MPCTPVAGVVRLRLLSGARTMGHHTPIEWADDSINPVMGCDGCELSSRRRREVDSEDDGDTSEQAGHCYAEEIHRRRAGRPGYAPDFFTPTLFAGRVKAMAASRDLVGVARPGKPWLDGRRRKIFVSDMGDALSRDVPFEFLLHELVDVVAAEQEGRRHDWLWLTKQPRRMAQFAAWLLERGNGWPPNLWAGTSVTSMATLGRARAVCNFEGPRMRFLSLEPLLASVVLPQDLLVCEGGAEYGRGLSRTMVHAGCCARKIRWLIVGGESGMAARFCQIDSIRSVLGQARAAGVPCFVKQLGARALPGDEDAGRELKPSSRLFTLKVDRVLRAETGKVLRLGEKAGRDWEEWPEDLRVRQLPPELPSMETTAAPVGAKRTTRRAAGEGNSDGQR